MDGCVLHACECVLSVRAVSGAVCGVNGGHRGPLDHHLRHLRRRCEQMGV